MATPIVENEHGTFRYDTDIRRWICMSGRIPGGGPIPHTNCTVYLAYAQELSSAALANGFTKEDFGVPVKTVKVKKPKSAKPKARKSRVVGTVLFDFSE